MKEEENIVRNIEKVVNADPRLREMFARIVGSSPRGAYWESPTKRFQFHYNTQPLTPSAETKNKQWAATIYKKEKNNFRLVKVIYFSKRKSAKARAYKWYKASVRNFKKKADKEAKQAFGIVSKEEGQEYADDMAKYNQAQLDKLAAATSAIRKNFGIVTK